MSEYLLKYKPYKSNFELSSKWILTRIQIREKKKSFFFLFCFVCVCVWGGGGGGDSSVIEKINGDRWNL